jgi:hypothetical protein
MKDEKHLDIGVATNLAQSPTNFAGIAQLVEQLTFG